MERELRQIKSPEITMTSLKKEISGETFKVYCPEVSKSHSVYRMGPTWYKLTSSALRNNFDANELEGFKESFLSLINTNDHILVPTVKDGLDMANFCSEFTERYENAFNLGNLSRARTDILTKTYALGGFVEDENLPNDYFDQLRKQYREERLQGNKNSVNLFIISDIVKHSPIPQVVKDFANYVDSQEHCNGSLSIYSNFSSEYPDLNKGIIELSNYIQSLSEKAKAKIMINISSHTNDAEDIAVAVGDVYLGLSNNESYSKSLYKSIYAGKGLILPKSESAIQIIGSDDGSCARYINPHYSPSIIKSVGDVIENPDILSQMMSNNKKKANQFSRSEYDKRVRAAVLGKIASIHELTDI